MFKILLIACLIVFVIFLYLNFFGGRFSVCFFYISFIKFWFETDVAKEEKLAERTAATLGLFNYSMDDDYQLFTE